MTLVLCEFLFDDQTKFANFSTLNQYLKEEKTIKKRQKKSSTIFIER